MMIARTCLSLGELVDCENKICERGKGADGTMVLYILCSPAQKSRNLYKDARRHLSAEPASVHYMAMMRETIKLASEGWPSRNDDDTNTSTDLSTSKRHCRSSETRNGEKEDAPQDALMAAAILARTSSMMPAPSGFEKALLAHAQPYCSWKHRDVCNTPLPWSDACNMACAVYSSLVLHGKDVLDTFLLP